MTSGERRLAAIVAANGHRCGCCVFAAGSTLPVGHPIEQTRGIEDFIDLKTATAATDSGSLGAGP